MLATTDQNNNYNNPNPLSEGDTYRSGRTIPQNNGTPLSDQVRSELDIQCNVDLQTKKIMNGSNRILSFPEIRKRLLENLKKEYNYIYPRYLDAYKRWKSNMLDSNSSEAQTAKQDYTSLDIQLNNINKALDKLNSQTLSDLNSSSERLFTQDKEIFRKEKAIQNESNNLTELNDRLHTDSNKMRDYQILNRSWGHRVLFWTIITIVVVLLWLATMAKFYGFKRPGEN